MSKPKIFYAIGHCDLGHILLARNADGICSIALADNETALLAELHQNFPHAVFHNDDAQAQQSLTQVITAIENPKQTIELPLAITGTAFQQHVWQALRDIPAGTTLSYSQLAQRLGKPQAVRAVASACAANKIAILIPCHRIVRSNGELSGYRWGIERKQALLEREKSLSLNANS